MEYIYCSNRTIDVILFLSCVVEACALTTHEERHQAISDVLFA